MKTSLTVVLPVVVAIGCIALSATALAEAVVVKISTIGPDAKPIVGACVDVDAGTDIVRVVTDENGSAEAQFTTADGAKTVFASFSAGWEHTLSDEAKQSARRCFAGWLTGKTGAMNPFYTSMLHRDEAHQHIVMRVEPAVHAILHCVDGAGNPVAAAATLRESTGGCGTAYDGNLTIRGIPKGTPSEALIDVAGQLLRKPIAPLAEDTDLGQYVVPDMPKRSASVTIHLGAWPSKGEGERLGLAGATLVSLDGSLAYQVLSHASPIAGEAQKDSEATLKVAPGTYVVVPGICARNKIVFDVLDAARSGRLAGAAGLPVVVAVSAEERALSINVGATMNAIRAAIASASQEGSPGKP